MEHTPTAGPLGACKDDDPFDEDKFSFRYVSAIGQLMYLIHTRCDIQFAVHQCARFTRHPKCTHGITVQQIVHYLCSTKDQGLDYKTCQGPIKFDNYVADFTGLFGYEDDQDPSSAKSRSGYIFTLGGNPIHWKSKQQSTIELDFHLE